MINDKDQMHPDDIRNLIIFGVAAMLMWFLFDTYLLEPRLEKIKESQEAQIVAAEHKEEQIRLGIVESIVPPQLTKPRAAVIADIPRLKIDNGSIFGSMALVGGRIDDLSFQDHYDTLEKTEHVVLLSPAGTEYPRYVEMGWVAGDTTIKVPDHDTRWQVEGNDLLTQGHPVTVYWNNDQGLRFERYMELDDHYMFKITQRIVNNGSKAVTLFSYGLITQHDLSQYMGSRSIVHEGPIAYVAGELMERSYRKMKKTVQEEAQAAEGWIGITDKYWLTTLIPDQTVQTKFRFVYSPSLQEGDREKYQVDIMGGATVVAAGQSGAVTTRLFSGAKEIKLLGQYEKSENIRHFDLTVDFGMYYFMTKPFFYILDFFGGLVGNFGIAIIMLTVLIRAAVFPLANTSFRSFAKLKEISPQMKEMRDKYSDDKEKLQKELVKLYEREKVNPAAGCFPILLQIPIFFALYKVLNMTIEMRHAPFFGWIKDLSAPDPTTVFNLFGLIPWQPPSPLMIGVWPCLMLLAMMVQKRLNPPPQDPNQAFMMNLMPFFMAYILAKFSAGLVIYWTFSNILSVVQQYIIMRSMGVEVHLFKWGKAEKEMAAMVKDGPVVHPGLGVIEDEIEDALSGHDKAVKKEKAISPPKPKKKRKKK